ncbi:MAG: flavoprotein [Actinomycetota bacterium]
MGSSLWSRVPVDLWSSVHEVPHINWQEADAIVIAPTTADLIAKLAAGRADDY